MRPRLALLALSLGACPDVQSDDPLDPAAVAAAAEAAGTAEGTAFGGPYAVTSAQRECTCRRSGDLDPCELLPGLSGPVQLTHVDGYLTLFPLAGPVTFGLSGAVDGDGGFALAAIADIGSLLSAGDIFARLDGRFHGDRTFTGDLAYRVLGELGDDPLDCRAAFTVRGEFNGGL